MNEEPEVNLPPKDVVPQTGVTADLVRRLDSALAGQLTVTFPGDVICDLDGVPIGVEESITVTGTAIVRISRTELHRAGLTDKEVNHVRITD